MQPGLRTGVVLLTVLLAAQLAVIAMRGILRAGVGAVSADRVLGQSDFIKNAPNFVDAIGMNAPADVAIDQVNGHVLVADSQNNRVLGWKSASAFTSGGAADLVIGQPDFHSFRCNSGRGGAERDDAVPSDRSRVRRGASCVRGRRAKQPGADLRRSVRRDGRVGSVERFCRVRRLLAGGELR